MNPEFKRNCWLELSPARLVLMPVLIILALMVVITLDDNVATDTLSLSFAGFVVITIFWGNILANSNLSREFSEGTWDSQRMSALTPWQMAWGKLFGSTLCAWYGGVILLFFAVFPAFQLDYPLEIFLWFCILICSAITLHALGLIHILLARRKNPDNPSRPGIVSLISIVLFFFLLVSLPPFSPFARFKFAQFPLWWGHDLDPLFFTLVSFVFLTLWTLIGLWETMRRELMLPNRFWWWPLFLLFWFLWSAGFVQNREDWSAFLGGSAILIGFCGYALFFFTRKDQGMWLRLIAAARHSDKRLLRHLEPGWLISFVISIGLWIVAVLLSADVMIPLMILLAICAFILRDVAWILWLNLAPNARRADGATLVSLIVAYGLLPLLFHGDEFSFFLPPSSATSSASALITLISALIQAALCGGLFYRRWRALFRSVAEPRASLAA